MSHGAFPTDIQEFDADDRISFSKLDNKFIAVHDDGTEFEFDNDQKQWLPLKDDPIDDNDHDSEAISEISALGKRKYGGQDEDELQVSAISTSTFLTCL